MPFIKGSTIDDHQDFTWKGSKEPTALEESQEPKDDIIDLNTKYPYGNY